MNIIDKSECSIVVIGASAGGVEALKELIGSLPASFSAAVFIVLHVGEVSYMPEILARISPIPVRRPVAGERFSFGTIYVAPPGRHMLVHEDHILLRRGPRENLARPAIDPLFRSAACSFGTRTIGVILTGSLSDGASGLHAIKRCGGRTIVQDPDDALVPDMPRNALQHVKVDHCVPLADLGELLASLVREPPAPPLDIPTGIRLEAAIAAQEHSTMRTEEKLGALSPFTCPECYGPLWEIEEDSIVRYRCHVGHALSAEALVSAHAAEAETMIGKLLRLHQQRAAMAHRLAARDLAEGRLQNAELMKQRAQDYDDDVEIITRLRIDPENSERHDVRPDRIGDG